ncbi:uncharacterized protein LOC130141580 [Falco biarmicus]|uniref:uncharacterized protein LOC106112214 n=1 Tax=Falco peregrinus TaxID=8954 RepID=UPI000678DE27|nr:uncharacterized protein LOC106112214 [Falco peregrinus]XP_014131899.1 uncharacterized protein LOC106630841 [Falco cherrug]XP_037227158.1 uncharacterized protein LOC119140172 [Falco rusticolus]XP_040433895.1 uncharacterized protein LOC121080098 [Falco naumanni]XP_056178580.1 uncharacterized protein LOC130141580 [Falco biarmicus]
MHYYGERYKHLYLPGSSCVTESIQQCMPQSDGYSTTCHPVSVIKSPMPRWQSYTQPLTYVCSQPSVPQPPLLSCQPYVQRCVLLYPEPCETTRLLPCRKPSLKLSPGQSFQPCDTSYPEKKRMAKSLPPCAPRCPEPSKLKFPPCGIKYSSSCKDECRSQKISKCSSQRYGAELRSLQGMTGYSPPLRGVTECPPQQCITQSFLQECVNGFPQQKCMKGYPTQECVTTYTSQQRVTKCQPQPHMPKCPPGQAIKECSSQQHAVKCSLPQEAAKHKSSSTQHLSKSKCLYPRATQHSTQHHSGGVKRSSHSKKSRCVSKCLC